MSPHSPDTFMTPEDPVLEPDLESETLGRLEGRRARLEDIAFSQQGISPFVVPELNMLEQRAEYTEEEFCEAIGLYNDEQ